MTHMGIDIRARGERTCRRAGFELAPGAPGTLDPMHGQPSPMSPLLTSLCTQAVNYGQTGLVPQGEGGGGVDPAASLVCVSFDPRV